MSLYESIDVWKRVDEHRLVRYRCFKVICDSSFCVQSSDIYHIPMENNQLEQHQRQFTELLLEEAPDARSETYSSLEDAIANHDSEFGEL